MLKIPRVLWPLLSLSSSLALLLIVPFVVYWPYLGDFFALDDFIWLHAASTHDAGRFFRDAFGFPDATPFGAPTPFWRPLIDAYFYLARRLYGLEPMPYHVTNVALHAINAVLLAVLARRLSGSRGAGLVVALLWCVLPSYDIAVLWISEVTELLAALWYLSALVLYAGSRRRGRRAGLLYGLSLAATVLALLSKQSSVTLPLALAGLSLTVAPPRSRRDVLRCAGELAPFFTVALIYAAFLYVREYPATADPGLYTIGPHALANGWDFLLRLGSPMTRPDGHVTGLASRLGAVCFLAAGGAALTARSRVLAFAFAWTLLALLPYSFFTAGTEARYLYLPAAPFVLFWVLLTSRLLHLIPCPRRRYRVAVPLAGVVAVLCVLLGAETRQRQAWLHEQAAAFEQFVTETPVVCGPLPEDGQIYVLGGPAFDLFGENTRMALNLQYPRVRIRRVDTGHRAAPVSLSRTDCVVHYSDGRYTRVLPD